MPTLSLTLTLTRAATGYTATLAVALPTADTELAAGVPLTLNAEVLRSLEHIPNIYGAALTEMVFSPPLREAWARGCGASAGRGDALRLCLALDPTDDALHALLWETLRDPLTNLPLARGEAVRLVRYLPSASLADLAPPPRPALRAVVAVAAPAEVPPLDVPALVAAARAGLGAMPSTVLDGRDGRLPATLPNLTAALRDGAPILILACHGALIEGEPYLWLEQAGPGPYRPIAGTAFVAALAQLERKPLLVVLAACQGAGTSYEVLRAVGPQLARVGVGAVLAMREQIPQATVAALLPPLFAELRRDGALDRALAAARAALGENHPWWLPVLWLRTRDGLLWREEVPPPPPTPSGTTGTANVSGTVNGVAVGVNLGTIIYGRDPSEDQRRRLVWYLEALAGDLRCLPLRGLDTNLAQATNASAHSTGISLAQVYVMVATTQTVTLAKGTAKVVGPYFEDADPRKALLPAYDPEQALPDVAVVNRGDVGREGANGSYHLVRQRLGSEVAHAGSFVLLGDPGGGKSTFLHHLAWVLAQRGLDQLDATTRLCGWADATRLMPVLLPLRTLAATIAGGVPDATSVYTALRTVVANKGVATPDDLLTDALVRGAVLILLDGLDEVPVAATPTSADRLTTLRAVRAFAERYGKTRVLLTCRTRAFTDAVQVSLGWPVETLAPFTLGQIRHFVPAWYDGLVTASFTRAQAARLSAELVATIAGSTRLREMAATPLLLTLMALLLYHRGTLPRDRPRLYEEIMLLLLGQWDKVREGQNLAEVIGRPDWTSDRLRPLLDALSYKAHLAGSSLDGRGRLDRDQVQLAFTKFFAAQTPPLDWGTAERCLTYFDQRSGLLAPDGLDSYVFAHLTLQEHCAGRHMLLSRDAVDQVLAQRSDDRWREPIFLGLGVVQANNPYLIEKVLRTLLERDEGGVPKPVARWYRDLILVAEIGQDRDWAYLRDQRVDVTGLHTALHAGFTTLLADGAQPIPVAERIRAGTLLGTLSDPRIPVTAAQWQAEWTRRNEHFGQPTGYWCYVRQEAYRIGGWAAKEPEATIALPAFWLARYPITVAQYAPFVAEGYREDAEHWWTTAGWQWKQSQQRTQPWRWDHPDYSGANQPVIGVTWYEATAYCAWLNDQVAAQGYEFRLPTEAEWEAAAAYDAQMQRRNYPWGADEPTPERAIYKESKLGRPAPVGCCPSGAAACGVLDLAGNVWEWTTSSYKGYPAQSGTLEKGFTPDDYDVPFRGGYYNSNRTNVRCGARNRGHPVGSLLISYGVRVCAAPLFIADNR